MRLVTEAERRARLAKRHGLAPGHRYKNVEDVTDAMTALHATEAATVHLAVHARTNDVGIGDVEDALYRDRSIVKQLAMRRTLFAFPRDLLPAVWGSTAQRVADQQHKQVIKFVTEGGMAEDADAWTEQAYADTLAALADGTPRTTAQIRELVPELDKRFTMGTPGKKWGGDFPIGRWVIGTVSARGDVVRATNAGHWRLNKPTWTITENWLAEPHTRLGVDEGYAELVRRWLWTFGPGTEADIVWWLGATKTAVRRALAEVGAAQVEIGSGETGYVLPDDPIQESPEEPVEPWGTLLPTLDPTVMGWKQREFYLEPEHVPYLFDTNGNAGNTLWWDGRIVGAWAQQDDGSVRILPIGDLGADATATLEAGAERLTKWLDGVVITNVYASQQMKQVRLS